MDEKSISHVRLIGNVSLQKVLTAAEAVGELMLFRVSSANAKEKENADESKSKSNRRRQSSSVQTL